MFRKADLGWPVLAGLMAAACPVAAASQSFTPDQFESGQFESGQIEQASADPDPAPELALMGTVPIFWGEADGLAQIIAGDAPAHWARQQLEAHFSLTPLDYLDAASLAPQTRLFMAQPRGLSAQENVALDGWVRAGGQLLLLADPLMTGESHFGLGDRRRPQDMVLLSPILDHWGLQLQFDEQQAQGFITREIAGQAVPLNQPGQIALTGGDARCTLHGAAVLAHCTLGEGRIIMLADAALVDMHEPHPAAPAALELLLARAFTDIGEIAGSQLSAMGGTAENPVILRVSTLLSPAVDGDEPPS